MRASCLFAFLRLYHQFIQPTPYINLILLSTWEAEKRPSPDHHRAGQTVAQERTFPHYFMQYGVAASFDLLRSHFHRKARQLVPVTCGKTSRVMHRQHDGLLRGRGL